VIRAPVAGTRMTAKLANALWHLAIISASPIWVICEGPEQNKLAPVNCRHVMAEN
jgi:hypothetical protein